MTKFRGKFTTTDKMEAKKNPDLIYFSHTNFNKIKPIKVIRCKECKRVLDKKTLVHNFYCDEYCYEMKHLPKIKHVCGICGIALSPFLYQRDTDSHLKGSSTSSYPKFCPRHKYGKFDVNEDFTEDKLIDLKDIGK